MKLHENKEQLADAIRITSAELGIPQKFVEKDYWICQILQRLSRMPKPLKAAVDCMLHKQAPCISVV